MSTRLRKSGSILSRYLKMSDHLHVILKKKKEKPIICLVRQYLYILFFEHYNLKSSSPTVLLTTSLNHLSWGHL